MTPSDPTGPNSDASGNPVTAAPSTLEGHGGLAIDPNNPRAADIVRQLQPLVDLTDLGPDICVVVGGDGHMLSTIRERGASVVYLGINAGRLGFLLNDVTDLPAAARHLRNREWTVSEFPRLRLHAERPDGSMVTALAVNDLYMERATGQTAHLQVRINGHVVVSRMICDGMLVATALGSTAYSYSAGGVPCHPKVRALLATPISPHVPRLAPMALPLNAVVELEALDIHRRPVRAVADGVDLGEVTRMTVEDADDEVRLAFIQPHDFTRAMFRKVLRT